MDTLDGGMSSTAVARESSTAELRPLSDKWVLWAHLPHDTDWTIGSYKKIMEVGSVEAIVALYSALPDKLLKNCMLFLMKGGVTPTWEDPANRDGGCFSFKVSNKNVSKAWKTLSYMLVGCTLVREGKLEKLLNGITISPKRAFCIIKIWLASCAVQNPRKLEPVYGLEMHGCLFRKHKPEY